MKYRMQYRYIESKNQHYFLYSTVANLRLYLIKFADLESIIEIKE